ncbi:MAG: hypothetical protein M1818_003166 [Claussenomyces sp. TS43310]|nr:MAG: hypothetical protein M1818_003166 [Claussenomyces sp. TS43310]
MFSSLAGNLANVPIQNRSSREVPPPTTVKFPDCIPRRSERDCSKSRHDVPLVTKLREIQRPPDVKVEHLEAMRLHVIPDASPEDVIPDGSYLPPKGWNFIPEAQLDGADQSSLRMLNNDRYSPGVKTYVERTKELSISNPAAFRSIRRLPAAPGDSRVRLGNAYEFFRNLELMSSFWVDTSLPPEDQSAESMDVDIRTASVPELPVISPSTSSSQQGHHRTGTGSSMPNEYRVNLLHALTKLVAYDFGCNVSLPRVEPRLHISSPPVDDTRARTSSFPSNISFVFRTPTDRSSARSGIVEGPVVTLSSRPTTGFENPTESLLDLCREITAVLITAQQRARETQSEVRVGEGMWWCTAPRWGGGTGGPIGREGERLEKQEAAEQLAKREGKEDGPSPKRSKKTLSIYDSYRMVRPPSSTWDRKTRYLSIGKEPGVAFDDVFLLSALNHHVSVVRVRVPASLLDRLAGHEEQVGGGEGRREGRREGADEECVMWRSRWYDMFLIEERVAAMRCIWGMMAYLMRKTDTKGAEDKADEKIS